MQDIMDDDDVDYDNDEETDKIINEIEAQNSKGGSGGMKEVKKDDVRISELT